MVAAPLCGYKLCVCAVGGGKPKMRWYFKEHGWPTSSVLDEVPRSERDQATLIDTLQVRVTESVCVEQSSHSWRMLSDWQADHRCQTVLNTCHAKVDAMITCKVMLPQQKLSRTWSARQPVV